jgi:hypothetical protein
VMPQAKPLLMRAGPLDPLHVRPIGIPVLTETEKSSAKYPRRQRRWSVAAYVELRFG